MSLLKAVHERYWAISPEGLDTILQVASRSSDYAKFVESRQGEPLEYTYRATIKDGVATLPFHGPAFRYANLITRYSGGTSMEMFAKDFTSAMDNKDVRAILMDIDSPGGEANGNGELARLIYKSRGPKPILSYASGACCSAAYYVGSAADAVYADSIAVVGSIGALCAFDRRNDGEKEPIVVVSDQSPEKYADPESKKGQAKYKTILNDMAGVFIGDVAKFRGVTSEHVQEHYGRGGVFIGQKAVDSGLVDGLSSYDEVHGMLARGEFRKPVKRSVFYPTKGAVMPKNGQASTDGIEQAETDPVAENSEVALLKAKLAQMEQSNKAKDDELLAARQESRVNAEAKLKADATLFAEKMFADNRITPGQKDRAIARYLQAARDDRDHPLGDGQSRTGELQSDYESRPKHIYDQEIANSNTAKQGEALKQDPSLDKPVDAAQQAGEEADVVAAADAALGNRGRLKASK